MTDLKVGPKARALIQYFEGCQLTAYRCPAGIWTIGYGDTGPEVKKGVRWSQAQADAAFARRLDAEFAPAVQRAIGDVSTTPAQLGAMVSLAYNIGTGAFAKSSVVKFHRTGMIESAANAFGMWNKAGGRVLPGLTRRRAAEAALYRSDMIAVAKLTAGAVQ